MPVKTKPIEERFWPKVDTSGGPNSCWPWKGRKAWNGYGEFRMPTRAGKLLKSHRVAYELTRGPVSKDLDLDHLCRNRACANPAHLEPVDRKTNSLRGDCGKHNAKLSEQDFEFIKQMRGKILGTELAKMFGVNKARISHIQLRRSH